MASKVKDEHIGEQKFSKKYQMNMEIIKNGNYGNIIVKFEDEFEIETTYDAFKNDRVYNGNFEEHHIGEEKINKDGDLMRIIDYTKNYYNSGRCAYLVLFPKTNSKKWDKDYSNFRNNKVLDPLKHNLVGQKFTVGKNNLIVEVIDQKTKKNLTIMFIKDRTIRKNVSHDQLKNGCLAHPNEKVNHLGEVKTMRNGEKATVIEYNSRKSIKIQFEDGTIESCSYDNFEAKNVANRNSKNRKSCSLQETYFLYYLSKIGFKRKNAGYFKKFSKNFGNRELDLFNEELMIGIEYDGHYWHNNTIEKDLYKDKLCKDCNIELFRIRESDRGKKLPKLNSSSHEIERDGNSLTDIKIAIEKIVQYINKKHNKNFNINVDIERDNEDILTLFKSVGHKSKKDERIGQTSFTKKGELMTIVEYFTCDNLTVEFEDGTRYPERTYQQFKESRIAKPIN